MWIARGWVKVTGATTRKRARCDAETIDTKIVTVSVAYHEELVEQIRVRMERIYAESSESSVEEDREVSLVRVDGGV